MLEFLEITRIIGIVGNSTYPTNAILFYLSIYSTRICPLFCRLVLGKFYKSEKKIQLEAFEKK